MIGNKNNNMKAIKIIFSILFICILFSCNKIRITQPNNKRLYVKNYDGDVVINKITIDRNACFIITATDLNKNKVQFMCYDLIFNINDTTHIKNMSLIDNGQTISIYYYDGFIN